MKKLTIFLSLLVSGCATTDKPTTYVCIHNSTPPRVIAWGTSPKIALNRMLALSCQLMNEDPKCKLRSCDVLTTLEEL